MAWKKGESGNPSGRPKAAKGLRELLQKKYGQDARELVQRLDKLSTARNPKIALAATEILMAYLAGKPTQSVEHDGNDGGPIRVVFGGRYRPGGDADGA